MKEEGFWQEGHAVIKIIPYSNETAFNSTHRRPRAGDPAPATPHQQPRAGRQPADEEEFETQLA